MLVGMIHDDAFVDLDALSRRLRLPKAWLRREARAGRIPALMAGKQRRFNVEAVRLVLSDRAAEGSPEIADRAAAAEGGSS